MIFRNLQGWWDSPPACIALKTTKVAALGTTACVRQGVQQILPPWSAVDDNAHSKWGRRMMTAFSLPVQDEKQLLRKQDGDCWQDMLVFAGCVVDRLSPQATSVCSWSNTSPLPLLGGWKEELVDSSPHHFWRRSTAVIYVPHLLVLLVRLHCYCGKARLSTSAGWRQLLLPGPLPVGGQPVYTRCSFVTFYL